MPESPPTPPDHHWTDGDVDPCEAPVDRGDQHTHRLRLIAIGAGLYALSGPGQTAGFSVFVDPLNDALDISRGQLTAGYLVATLLAAPSGIWLGRQLDRSDIATLIRRVGIGLAIALTIAASAPTFWVLVIAVFGLRLFGQTGFTLTSTVYVARSITQRRGAALGMLTATGGAAISLTPVVASQLIPRIGWRSTWLLLAVAVAVVAHTIAVAVARTAVATGSTVAPRAAELTRAAPTSAVVAVSTRRRRTAFLVIAAGYATTASVGTALSFHQIAILESRGLSATQAAANFLPQSLAAAAMALTVGQVVDRVHGRVVIPACMLLMSGALISIHLIDSQLTAVVYGLVLGSTVAAMSASEGALLARWLGTEALGAMRGRLMATVVTASAIGPAALTALVNVTGSYTSAATAALTVPVTVGILAAVAPLPPKPMQHAPST